MIVPPNALRYCKLVVQVQLATFALSPTNDGANEFINQIRPNCTILQTPISEEQVLKKLAVVERVFGEHRSGDQIPARDKYVQEFVAILRACNQRDSFRKSYDYELNREAISEQTTPPLELKMRTVAGLIRCLGNIGAEQASETLAEFLIFPSDLTIDTPRLGDVPARWALFQIGDQALPFLRLKMHDKNPNVRKAAANTAVEILGPRAAVELDKWIEQTTSVELKASLEAYQKMFRLVAENTRTESLTEYRRRCLAEGLKRISALRQAKPRVYPEDWN